MFRSILIANRGEIAVRIIRACRNMGIKSIAVYSKEDKDSLHVQLADRRVCIGEGPAKNSYLNMERIISAAKNTDADAIHPGFGFLSENADFVRLCKENGIAFICPPAVCMSTRRNGPSPARKPISICAPVFSVRWRKNMRISSLRKLWKPISANFTASRIWMQNIC